MNVQLKGRCTLAFVLSAEVWSDSSRDISGETRVRHPPRQETYPGRYRTTLTFGPEGQMMTQGHDDR